MESRIVKFNIKQFIEDYIYLYELGDKEAEIELINKYKKVFNISSEPIRVGMQKFLANSELIKDYETLRILAGVKPNF